MMLYILTLTGAIVIPSITSGVPDWHGRIECEPEINCPAFETLPACQKAAEKWREVGATAECMEAKK